MSLASEHPNPLAVIDAVIVDMRASGDTGHVENLIQAREDIDELIMFAKRVSLGPQAGCGCKPVCQCLSEGSLRIWAQDIEFDADYLLARIRSAP